MTTTKTTATKRPQVRPARKAKQPAWLRPTALRTTRTAPALERLRASDRSRGPPRLLDRHQVCGVANVSYPTLWAMMRRGEFPRSRVLGGKSMWILQEIEEWIAALPKRRLKGDPQLRAEA